MPIHSERKEINIYHQFVGMVNTTEFNQCMRFNQQSYQEIGDGMALIINLRQFHRFTVSTIHYIGKTMKNRRIPLIPIAVIGNQDNIFFSIIMSVVKTSGAGDKQIAFFNEEAQAESWIQACFKKYPNGRDNVVGRVDATAFKKQTKQPNK